MYKCKNDCSCTTKGRTGEVIFVLLSQSCNHPSLFAEVHLHFLIAGQLSGKTSLGCRAENRTRSGLPYSKPKSRRTTNWATPHPMHFKISKINQKEWRHATKPLIFVLPIFMWLRFTCIDCSTLSYTQLHIRHIIPPFLLPYVFHELIHTQSQILII
jgi:hypothetical protein